jgi:hypothetical protein
MNEQNFYTKLENSFTNDNYLSGELYDIQNDLNKRVVNCENFNTYYALKFPTIQGAAITIEKNHLEMAIFNESLQNCALLLNTKKTFETLLTIKKVDIDVFRVVSYHVTTRKLLIDGKKYFSGDGISHIHHYKFKQIYNLFNYPQTTEENAEKIMCETAKKNITL